MVLSNDKEYTWHPRFVKLTARFKINVIAVSPGPWLADLEEGFLHIFYCHHAGPGKPHRLRYAAGPMA